MVPGPTIRRLLCLSMLALLAACATDEDGDKDLAVKPGAPTLSALSLLRQFYFRGGTVYHASVPISPTFDPVILEYSASSEASTHTLIPEAGAPDTRMSVYFKNQPAGTTTLSEGRTGYTGNVVGGGPSEFSVVLQDTVKDLETTYRITVTPR